MFKKSPASSKLLTVFAVGIGLGLISLALYTVIGDDGEPTTADLAAERPAASSATAQADRRSSSPANEDPNWMVGQLRPNGLRIKPSGRSDASAVLGPNQFIRKDVRQSYVIAREIPAMLNKLYCWCGCENRGVHRSNLGCFEDRMAVNCDVCRGTAEIAYQMMQEGETDAGRIQAAVDLEWGPDWAKQEQRKRR